MEILLHSLLFSFFFKCFYIPLDRNLSLRTLFYKYQSGELCQLDVNSVYEELYVCVGSTSLDGRVLLRKPEQRNRKVRMSGQPMGRSGDL